MESLKTDRDIDINLRFECKKASSLTSTSFLTTKPSLTHRLYPRFTAAKNRSSTLTTHVISNKIVLSNT